MTLTLDLFGAGLWRHVKRTDIRARELADRHYSRQTVGAAEFMSSGRTFVLLAEVVATRAVLGVIENFAPGTAVRRLRCSIFRNETPLLSSDMIRAATNLTIVRWTRRFGWTGSPPLTTEVDPGKTRRKRDPGRCFRRAGWRVIGESRGLIVLQAPPLGEVEAFFLLLLLADPVARDRLLANDPHADAREPSGDLDQPHREP